MENNIQYSEEELREIKKEISKLLVQKMSPKTAMEMLKFAKKLKKNQE